MTEKTEKEIKQAQLIDLLPKKALNITACCKSVGISRQTFYAWLDESDAFKKAVNDQKEGMKDLVESVIYKKMIEEENTTMLIFFAKTKMQDRGYIEKQQIEHTGILKPIVPDWVK